ncbi:hypothetical protein [Mycolicibacterium diernhoferi]|uniref:Uncharacterized protein n=1 Tax=Mycolicibacterium diernhoferi TaxID=1801 RepID=A0A1Q4H7K9_9MYCO|nr:hypothetical protein [Mycolicibacterium diernhoferi]OJZ63508.1 hypothetical protein BRW64_22010 [Mycolicibacterium diernhoferi]OPE53773.1 hypothetical protein BV510_13790 [Mycolicibacterium diernhoferi]PEG51750.1 hypothetical protein CRI78_24775 [Mycolicibacterium diernhoferi]QYL24439.1 hypothetical protein K0O62_09385 [Mycolicibacterium diernhoferi]
MSPAEFDDALFHQVTQAVGPGTAILTLSTKNLNRVTAVDRQGVWVETERSMGLGSGPQLVPAWMIAVAWERLCDKGELSQQDLLNELNVKRSAFVCALLAKFPEVRIRSTRPTVLELQGE